MCDEFWLKVYQLSLVGGKLVVYVMKKKGVFGDRIVFVDVKIQLCGCISGEMIVNYPPAVVYTSQSPAFVFSPLRPSPFDQQYQ